MKYAVDKNILIPMLAVFLAAEVEM